MTESTKPDKLLSPTESTSEPSVRNEQHTPRRERFPVRLWEQVKKATVPAVIAGAVSLAVSLTTNHVQAQDAANQSRSEHQLQAMQVLQNVATDQFNTAMAIYRFQRQCVSGYNTWESCARDSPQISTYGDDSSAFDTAVANVADQQSKQLAIQFDTLCTRMFSAASAATGKQLMNQVVGTYLALNSHLGYLIQRQ